MAVLEGILESPIDLSLAHITEPGPGLLIATTRMTTVRACIAAILGLVCLAFVAHAWRNRATPYDIIWPHAVMIPVFGLLAVFLGFGHHRKSFDAAARTLEAAARLGPLSSSKSYPLPASATVKITLRKVYPSRAGGKGSMPTRWYDIAIPEVPAAGFTVASDREAARAFAKTLAASLRYTIVDEVEDDGVERIKP